jgi:hypothetical protein
MFSSVFGLTYQPELKPECLIMLELMCLKLEAVRKVMKPFTDVSKKRRDIWASKEEAYKLFKARPALKAWDDRVLRLHVVRTSLHSASWSKYWIRNTA